MHRPNPLREISHLIFPELCLSCSRELSRNENHICSICTNDLSHTHFELYEEPSPMDKLFWGRVPVANCYAHFLFEKGKVIQHMLFGLKYRNDRDIGVYFGSEAGKHLISSQKYNGIEAFVPVPLHPKKKFIRGYNQSKYIATGISKAYGGTVDNQIIKRVKHSSSQTKKNRFQRWENVDGVFSVHPRIKQFNHIAIVDDMITTGSTVESIINALRQQNPELSVSVITLAIAV